MKNMMVVDTFIPERLKPGDTIAVVSPSDAVTQDIKQQLDAGIAFLQGRGFKVELAPNALSNSLGYSASVQEKADDINEMFKARHIQSIICSQGGFNANGVLPHLNYEAIRFNPKIFLGMSDITVLLNAIYAKTGLITFHANDLMWGFGRQYTTYEENEFIGRIAEGRIGAIAHSSEWYCVRAGIAEGRLIGGNLQCLLRLAGTSYFPDLQGAILFLEEYGEESTITSLSAGFHQLKQMGVFDKINGLWLGYYHKTNTDTTIDQVAQEVTEDFDFPILKCADFGHNTPNTAIPVGCQARLDATNCNLELVTACVK